MFCGGAHEAGSPARLCCRKRLGMRAGDVAAGDLNRARAADGDCIGVGWRQRAMTQHRSSNVVAVLRFTRRRGRDVLHRPRGSSGARPGNRS
jgi:hypothetical protein